jgi:hypothetical protein
MMTNTQPSLPYNMDLKPYQQVLWDKVIQGGFKKGELMLITAGRRTGKSYLNNLCKEIMLPKFSKEASAIVDGEQWHTIRVNDKDLAKWLRTQSVDLVSDLTITSGPLFSLFDVHEKIYIILGMKQ